MPECGYLMGEDSDRHFGKPELKDASKKRNSTQPRWIQKIRVAPGMAVEGPLDDGFSWRKYGQKDILGSKHPRGYYRCTHRGVRGCSAMKQVQRSGDDPTIFEITYIGDHTSPSLAENDGVRNHLQSNTVSLTASRANFSFQARDDQTQVTDEYKIVQAAAIWRRARLQLAWIFHWVIPS
ncbi:putative WRKY transcription factor 30 [Hibiscus syriacus]|uniref:WRKY transcription factor 30 n=1 Tax=Hibiscus syriacus TaxID=106335 RepID=A0A6A2Y027_HIBSY|nr:putative WRKY transcription factor 30 [Hibiscus syriacus]